MRVIGHVVVAFVTALVALAVTVAGVVVGPAMFSGADREVVSGQAVRVYRPVPRPARPGLVLDLHPSGANGFLEQATTRLTGRADREGWLVAYPDGAGDWSPYGTVGEADEVAFLGAVIDRLVAADGVDPDRVYVMGLSRGGMQAYRVACELSVRVAAIAVVAGNMADEHGDAGGTGCRPARPVSVLAVHGTADTAVPIAGGGRFAPFVDVVARWRGFDGCGEAGSVSTAGPATRTEWTCGNGSAVASVVLAGVGHTWPGAPLAGLPWGPAETFDASDAVADFFVGHGRGAR